MDTNKIYIAQLDVCKCFTVDKVNELIDRLSKHAGKDVYYNNESRSIDIEEPSAGSDCSIRIELMNWLKTLDADEKSINVLCDNIDVVFNITRINIDGTEIIKLYLY